MAFSTDDMYNGHSRYIVEKFKIYFSPAKIVEVTRDQLLISSTLLEESYKASGKPFGDVTSNEVSLTLFNNNGIFNPENKDGPYYGLIKRGVKIEAFIKPDEADEWDPLGVFYVTDWFTTPNGLSVDVTANDAMYDVINGTVPSLPVYRQMHFKDFMELYFEQFGLPVTIDESIDVIFPYITTAFHSNNKTFLSDLMTSVLADCFCDHNGNPTIRSKVTSRGVRAKFTDSDQLINISIKQSIVTSYDSSSVTYHTGQESDELDILTVADARIEPGITHLGPIDLSKTPALRVNSIKTAGLDAAKVIEFKATADTLNCDIQSSASGSIKLNTIGTMLETVSGTLSTEGNSPLKVGNKFIYSELRAQTVKKFLDEYIAANNPTIDLTVRGNPKLELGDIIEVDSNQYKVRFYGMLIKASYEYVGHLTCKMTLAYFTGVKEV